MSGPDITLDTLLATIRAADPTLAQTMMLDALDLPSGAWAELHGPAPALHGCNWDLALALHRYLSGT